MTIALIVLPGTPAGVLAAFGSVALLGTADFGGSIMRRLTSLLASGLAGAVLIAIGVLASLSPASLVIITFAVTACLSYVMALRGAFASASPALTTVYVASAMLSTSVVSLGPLLIGWAIALAIAIPVTLVILPRRTLIPVRSACAGALHTLAEAVRERAAGQGTDVAAVQAALQALQKSYLGNPFRASGIRAPDRALLVLTGQIQALLAAVSRAHGYAQPHSGLASTHDLIQACARTLDEASGALSGTSKVAPSAAEVARLWGIQWDEAVDLLATSDPGQLDASLQSVDRAFPDRAMAISVVRLVILTRRVLGLPDESYDIDGHTIPEPPLGHPWRDLAAQLTLRSPWLRTALRTGAALAIAVLAVEILGLAHGFWVLLGVIATLRFDGMQTLRTSLWAVVGTFAGVLIGVGILELDHSHRIALWSALALVVFLAVYAQATTAFVVGQAAFSVFIIVAVSIANWPPQIDVASQRFIDIAVGAAISTAVALLMWPRGVINGLVVNLVDYVRQSQQLLANAVSDIVSGTRNVTTDQLADVSDAFARAREVVEVALSSARPESTEHAHEWAQLIDHMRTLGVAAHLIAGWSSDRPPIDDVVPSIGPIVTADLAAAEAAWTSVTCRLQGTSTDAPPTLAAFLDRAETALAGVDVSDPAAADRVVGATWTDGWLQMTYRAALSAEAPLTPAR